MPDDDTIFGGPGHTSISTVVVGGPGLVAVGAGGDPGNWDAAVWTSVDGLVWSRVPDDEEVFGGAGDQGMFSVAVGGPGLVAVGFSGRWEDQDAAVWTSIDGLEWSRVPHSEAVFGGSPWQGMSSVVAGGPGLVAVGFDGVRDILFNAAVWTSADGLRWSRVPRDEAVFGGPGRQEMTSVVVAGPGLIAVGFSGLVGHLDAAVWTSVDGLVWSRVPDDEPVFGGPDRQQMICVVVGGPGLVAVGTDGSWTEPDAAVWTSPPH